MTFSCPVLGGSPIISNLQSIFVNHVLPERSIPLNLASWFSSCAIGVEVSSEDSATPPNDSLPVQLPRRSLSRLRDFLIINVDDPRYSPPLLLRSVAMTSSLVPLLKSLRSSNIRQLSLRIAVQTLFHFLISYAELLIPIPSISLGGSCKHTTSALRLTPISSATMVHSYDLAQLCWITRIIGSQGTRFSLSRGRSRDLSLSHHDLPRLPRCLLFLRISLLLPFAICCPTSLPPSAAPFPLGL